MGACPAKSGEVQRSVFALRLFLSAGAAFLHYLDREDSRLTIVHLFADAEALDRHLEGAETRAEQAWQVMEREAWEIYGPASDQAQTTMRRQAEWAGVPLTAHVEYIAGFVRLA